MRTHSLARSPGRGNQPLTWAPASPSANHPHSPSDAHLGSPGAQARPQFPLLALGLRNTWAAHVQPRGALNHSGQWMQLRGHLSREMSPGHRYRGTLDLPVWDRARACYARERFDPGRTPGVLVSTDHILLNVFFNPRPATPKTFFSLINVIALHGKPMSQTRKPMSQAINRRLV